MTHFDMELTQRQAQEYEKATKKQKGQIITQYCKLTRVSRNLTSKRFRKVIRNLYPRILKKSESVCRKGRKPKYHSIHKAIIHKAWELSSEICGERLHSVLNEYISQLETAGELRYCGKRYINETKTISERTLKRVIDKFPKASKKRHYGNDNIYKAIPIDAHFGRNADKPGFVEVDYVEHNGGSSQGDFACTGTYVDINLGWLARATALGKSKVAIGEIHDNVELRIFHKIHEYHPDNAKPILKLLLERKLNPSKRHYTISRSRPYHKEDNGHVEQKNGDKIRKLVGYHRYDQKEQVELLNQLYEVEDQLSNYFVPSQKLTEKVMDDKGRVLGRKHDKAKTAYQRLMESSRVNKKIKRQVKEIHKGLNLIQLRKQSEELQKHLFNTVISRKNIMA